MDELWRMRVEQATRILEAKGHTVEATDIPGLFRINGGPELTTSQLLSVAMQGPRQNIYAPLPPENGTVQ